MIRASVEHVAGVPRVTIDSATVGLPVVGVSASGASWEVIKDFPGHRIVDPLAPINQAIWYEQGDDRSAAVIRESTVYTAFTSLDGKKVVPFIMPHEWEDVTDPDVKVFQVHGRTWTVAGKHPKIGARTIQARVEGKHVETMRGLIAEGASVAFLHAPCPVPSCPVPDALTGVVTAGPGSLSQRFDLGEMTFAVAFQERSFSRPVSAVSWADIRDGFATWADVRDSHATWAGVRDGDTL